MNLGFRAIEKPNWVVELDPQHFFTSQVYYRNYSVLLEVVKWHHRELLGAYEVCS